MENNDRDNKAKAFRHLCKIENSFYGSREHWSDGTVRNYRTIWQPNDGFVGVPSLRNKETYVFDYDPKTKDFVGKWKPTPDFVKRSLGIEDTSHNMHDEH